MEELSGPCLRRGVEDLRWAALLGDDPAVDEDQAVEADPRNSEARFARAEVLEGLGKLQEARADYEKVLNQAYVSSAKHTSTWAKLWADATGLPSATMLQASKDDVNTPVKIDTTVINAEQKLVDAFYKAGEIPTDVKMTGYMTGQFNSTVTGSTTTSAGGSVTGGGS